ncbi:NLRC3 [Symbiodinium natans]|uniref:NLRC3 protein n=1 Tax=Symbiodinium natans TaxID=878477 RepID=A0A812NDM8_9DINO|nr:NLRC3 [Symbiodinium natans]
MDATGTSNTDWLERMGVDERAIFWCGVMLGISAVTLATGTAVLKIATIRSKRAARRQVADAPSTDLAKAETIGSTVSLQDVQPLKAAQPQKQAIGQLRRGRQLLAVFLSTFGLCLGLVLASIADGSLSKETGLAWERYAVLLSLGCVWLLSQAAMAACTLETGRGYATTAFAEAMLAGVCPVIADSFDTLKDTIFGGLCLKSSHVALQVVGILSWAYLVGFHLVFITEIRFMAELAASHLSMTAMPTIDVINCSPPKITRVEKLIALAAKQISKTKRDMLMVENLPQAGFAVLYLAVEGGSPLVATLSLGIPSAQILASCCLHHRIQRRLVPWYALRFDAAVDAADKVLFRRLHGEISGNPELCLEIALLTRHFGAILEARRARLQSTGERDDAAQVATRLLGSANLGILDLNGFKNWDVATVEALMRHVRQTPWVIELVLRECQMEASLAPALERGLRGIRGLKELSLSYNPQLGNPGAEALAAALPHCGLERLFLDSIGVGSEGTEALRRALEEGAALKRLDLEGNDAIGGEAKAALKTCCQSRGVDLWI